MAFVQNEEVQLEERRQHCKFTIASFIGSLLTNWIADVKVVDAFRNALQLLET